MYTRYQSGYLAHLLSLDGVAEEALTQTISGAKSADMKAALVDHFRKAAKILICTEAGAEGINLQFCSLLINYNLPWNPQRVEQRIGRVHRYGQKHDVRWQTAEDTHARFLRPNEGLGAELIEQAKRANSSSKSSPLPPQNAASSTC
jgi:superfamily II DNA/RNA helicase